MIVGAKKYNGIRNFYQRALLDDMILLHYKLDHKCVLKNILSDGTVPHTKKVSLWRDLHHI